MGNLNTVLKWGMVEGLIGYLIAVVIVALPFCLGYLLEGGRMSEAVREVTPALLVMTIIGLSGVLGIGLGIVYGLTFSG